MWGEFKDAIINIVLYIYIIYICMTFLLLVGSKMYVEKGKKLFYDLLIPFRWWIRRK